MPRKTNDQDATPNHYLREAEAQTSGPKCVEQPIKAEARTPGPKCVEQSIKAVEGRALN